MRDRLQSKECARILKAVADPDRLKIIQCLQGGARHVSDIAQALKADIANVSHHLGVLRNAGLVLDEKQGKFVSYSLNPEMFAPAAKGTGRALDVIDLGCCRLELGQDE
jgi:ArsR family transcriptional regulator, nickel/cobalt-responsive transcriptional repressor